MYERCDEERDIVQEKIFENVRRKKILENNKFVDFTENVYHIFPYAKKKYIFHFFTRNEI